MAVDQSDDARWRPDQKKTPTYLSTYLPLGAIWRLVTIQTFDHSNEATWPDHDWAFFAGNSGPNFGWQIVGSRMSKIIFPSVQYTNTLIHKDRIKLLAVYIIQMYTLENIYQLNLYIGIGYILPKIGEYMSIEGCLWENVHFPEEKKHILEYTCFRIYIF